MNRYFFIANLVHCIISKCELESVLSFSWYLEFFGKIGAARMRAYATHCNVHADVNEIVFFELECVKCFSELLGCIGVN